MVKYGPWTMVVDDILSTTGGDQAIQPFVRLKDDGKLFSTEDDPMFDDSVWFADGIGLESCRNAHPVWADLEWDTTITF